MIHIITPGSPGPSPMDVTALLLSPLQSAFTISFDIIFPSFTIGLAAWLPVLEALYLMTGSGTYRVIFEFWLKVFGVAFGLGVVSGVVMGFQFGTNWRVLSKMSGPIQGPLLAYETFTAFTLEAGFFGVLIFGRTRVSAWHYLFSTAMVALGTTLSASPYRYSCTARAIAIDAERAMRPARIRSPIAATCHKAG